MADEKKDPEFPKPPKPPLTPPLPPALGKGVPPLPMQKLPPMQGGGVPPAKSTGPAAAGPAVPQEDLRIRDSEEKRKEMERKVLEMEKKLQEEREKVLLANLRSQEEAALSSKVEVSLKEIQEKLRRDRREQEMEEARARLEGRVKELEQKLAQERETWVHTLKGSMRQKEVQDREVETHFTARIQELERRWLEEKAQWQKAFLSKEEEIRTLKVTLEKMKGLESDILRLNMEKQNWEKDVSGLRSRLEETQKGKSELEAQVRGAQEKEKEFFELKSQLALLKSREERLMVDLERAQHDLATVGQRLEQEKEEELKTLRSQLEEALEAKEKQVAQLAQEKIRAVSELIKQRSTLTRLQAINVALERDRNQARAERAKIQQSTQGQTQEVQKLKEDLAQIHDRHLQELRDQQVSIRRELEASFRAELERQVYSERERAKKEKHGELMNFEKELRARLDREWEQKTSLQSSAVGELQQARGMAERSLAESEQKLSELQSKLSEAQQRVSKEESSRQALIQQNSQMDQALKNKANELIQQEANFNQKLNLLKQDTDARIKALQGQVESEKKKGADLLKQVQIKGEVEKKYKTVYPLAFLGVLGLGILGVIGWWWYQDLQRQAPSPAIPMKKAEAPAPATPPAPAEAQPPVLPVPVQDPVEQKTVAWVKGYYLSSKKKTVAQEVDPESRLPWDADKISEDLIQVSAGDYKFEANLKDMSLKGLNSLTSTLFTVPPQSPRQTRSRVRRRSSPQPQEEASAQSAPSTDQTEDSGFSLPGMKKMAVPE